jgi:hypothetical protein
VRITQTELNLIQNPRLHRRMMRLPLERGGLGELKKCPLQQGRIYKLQAGGKVTVTVMSVRREKLAALSLPDARREGYAGVPGALDAWRDRYGVPDASTEVWVVGFETGDRLGEFDRSVLLARHGDYTLDASQAVRGEPEVLMPLAKDLAAARAKAIERRVSPQQKHVREGVRHAETCQAAMKNMKARELIRRAQRNYEAAERVLLSAECVESDAQVAPAGSPGEADRPPAAAAVASLKPAA